MQPVMAKFRFIYLHNTTHRTTTLVKIESNSVAPSPTSNEEDEEDDGWSKIWWMPPTVEDRYKGYEWGAKIIKKSEHLFLQTKKIDIFFLVHIKKGMWTSEDIRHAESVLGRKLIRQRREYNRRLRGGGGPIFSWTPRAFICLPSSLLDQKVGRLTGILNLKTKLEL